MVANNNECIGQTEASLEMAMVCWCTTIFLRSVLQIHTSVRLYSYMYITLGDHPRVNRKKKPSTHNSKGPGCFFLSPSRQLLLLRPLSSVFQTEGGKKFTIKMTYDFINLIRGRTRNGAVWALFALQRLLSDIIPMCRVNVNRKCASLRTREPYRSHFCPSPSVANITYFELFSNFFLRFSAVFMRVVCACASTHTAIYRRSFYLHAYLLKISAMRRCLLWLCGTTIINNVGDMSREKYVVGNIFHRFFLRMIEEEIRRNQLQ